MTFLSMVAASALGTILGAALAFALMYLGEMYL